MTLAVPADALRMTADFLRSMAGVEACCFWYGDRPEAGQAGVRAIIIPRQENRPGNYHVEPDAMIRVANATRPKGWKNLAQIHSHPGSDVHHSGYDDEMANSRRALSLIYPNYGSAPGMWRYRRWLWRIWPGAFPGAVGVHAFVRERWMFLAQADIAEAVNITSDVKPVLMDLR
jgi:hypothetical protein